MYSERIETKWIPNFSSNTLLLANQLIHLLFVESFCTVIKNYHQILFPCFPWNYSRIRPFVCCMPFMWQYHIRSNSDCNRNLITAINHTGECRYAVPPSFTVAAFAAAAVAISLISFLLLEEELFSIQFFFCFVYVYLIVTYAISVITPNSTHIVFASFYFQVYKKKTEAAKKEYLKALAAYRASLVSKVRS